jgi:hypothetical protein
MIERIEGVGSEALAEQILAQARHRCWVSGPQLERALGESTERVVLALSLLIGRGLIYRRRPGEYALAASGAVVDEGSYEVDERGQQENKVFQVEFRPAGHEKFQLLGDDGNEFESPVEAWAEAVGAARIGVPWDGGVFRVVDMGGEHVDDCGLGLGGSCDCRAPIVVLEGQIVIKKDEGVLQFMVVGSVNESDGSVRPADVELLRAESAAELGARL